MNIFALIDIAAQAIEQNPEDSEIRLINRVYSQTGCALASAQTAVKEAQRKARA